MHDFLKGDCACMGKCLHVTMYGTPIFYFLKHFHISGPATSETNMKGGGRLGYCACSKPMTSQNGQSHSNTSLLIKAQLF